MQCICVNFYAQLALVADAAHNFATINQPDKDTDIKGMQGVCSPSCLDASCEHVVCVRGATYGNM